MDSGHILTPGPTSVERSCRCSPWLSMSHDCSLSQGPLTEFDRHSVSGVGTSRYKRHKGCGMLRSSDRGDSWPRWHGSKEGWGVGIETRISPSSVCFCTSSQGYT